MPRLWAMTVDFEKVAVGDDLPILVKWETPESISRFPSPDTAEDEIPDPPESVPMEALTSYVNELLGRGFPAPSITGPGSSLSIDLLRPIPLGDTVSITGEVVNKWEEEARRLVECRVVIETDDGQPAATARAVVSF